MLSTTPCNGLAGPKASCPRVDNVPSEAHLGGADLHRHFFKEMHPLEY